MVIANWKTYVGAAESVRAARSLRALLQDVAGKAADIVLCPSFPSLAAVAGVLAGSRLLLGAQDVHHEVGGPYTGDVPVTHLRGIVRYVIVGHSERRRLHGETDALVAQKVSRAVAAGIHPIICVGETAEERAAGKTIARVAEQVRAVLPALSSLALGAAVFAYEPVWAISAGPRKPAPQPAPHEAAELIGLIRKLAAGRAGAASATRLRVVYGGSVAPDTACAFVSEPGVDGYLVGSASTKPAGFTAIVREVLRCRS